MREFARIVAPQRARALAGKAALARLLLFLDSLLAPTPKGLDILDQILKCRPNLPVIIFTAQGSVKNAVEAMRRGAVDFLEKPFSRAQFHLVLARVRRFHELSKSIERLEQEVKESNAQSPEPLLDSIDRLLKQIARHQNRGGD